MIPRANQLPPRTRRGLGGARLFDMPGVIYPEEVLRALPGTDPRTGKPYRKVPAHAMTTREAADLLGITPSAARALLHRKKVRHYKVLAKPLSLQVCWSRKAVARLLQKRSVPEDGPPCGMVDAAEAVRILSCGRTTLGRHVRRGRVRVKKCRKKTPMGPREVCFYSRDDLLKLREYLQYCHRQEEERRQKAAIQVPPRAFFLAKPLQGGYNTPVRNSTSTQLIMKPTLLVLAAGMGSRYGGLKQLDPMGPNGEVILDYSVYDAIRAGFGKVVFIIRKDFEEAFKSQVGARFAGKIEVDYAFQCLDDLPEGYSVPEGRVKPWGTAHALLAARNVVKEPFGVVNADDFYGADAFAKAAEFLTAAPAEDGKEHYGMIGYPLKNTLSDHGDVNRGICGIKDGYLDSVEEYTKIMREEDGVCRGDSLSGERKPVDPEELVSMNFWVFPASFISQIQTHFTSFMAAHGTELKSECYIPTVVDELIHNGKADCSVIKTTANWLGVTYPSDKPAVVESIAKLVEDGVYPAKLG